MIRLTRQKRKEFLVNYTIVEQELILSKYGGGKAKSGINHSAPKFDPNSEETLQLFCALKLTKNELVDIGMNLHCRLKYEEVVMHLRRAYVAGVTRVILTGSTIKNSRIAKEFCEKYYSDDYESVKTKIYFTVGIHPHEAKTGLKANSTTEVDQEVLKEINQLAESVYCVSYGKSFLSLTVSDS